MRGLATDYALRHQLQVSQSLLRLDGAYGDTVVLSDILAMGLGLIVRSRDYALLGRPEVLARPPSVCWTHPASGMTRELYDCPSIRLLPKGPAVRLLIATHPATDDPAKVGQTRNGVVYELFVSTLSIKDFPFLLSFSSHLRCCLIFPSFLRIGHFMILLVNRVYNAFTAYALYQKGNLQCLKSVT